MSEKPTPEDSIVVVTDGNTDAILVTPHSLPEAEDGGKLSVDDAAAALGKLITPPPQPEQPPTT